MCSQELLLFACLGMLLGGLRLTSTTTTTTFVAAMSIANQDLERYFRSVNATQTMTTMTEERIAMDVYNYAYLNYSYVMDQKPYNVSFNEEKARYGEGKVFSVSGQLVHITRLGDSRDDTACSAQVLGTRGDPTPPQGVTWIALVQRGGCTFEEKVAHVYAVGASAVIIYNDKQVMNLEKMQIKGKTRNITAVITYQDIGLEMARIVDQGIDMDAAIIEGRNGMRPINSLNRTSVLFVSISFIVLMVISLVWLIFYYIQRFRYLQTKDQQSRHLCSVTKKAIMKIPTKTGKSSDDKDGDSDCCAICIETYKASDCIRVLPCKHEFHKNCIDPWLIEHRTCPMCKLDVLKFYGFVVGDQVYSTPSAQHTPANAPVDDNDVPVIVVAVAPAPAPSASGGVGGNNDSSLASQSVSAAHTTQTTQAELQQHNDSNNSSRLSDSNSDSDNTASNKRSDSSHNNSTSTGDHNSTAAAAAAATANACSSDSQNNSNIGNSPNTSICSCGGAIPSTSTPTPNSLPNSSSCSSTSMLTEATNPITVPKSASAPVVRQVSTASRTVTDV